MAQIFEVSNSLGESIKLINFPKSAEFIEQTIPMAPKRYSFDPNILAEITLGVYDVETYRTIESAYIEHVSYLGVFLYVVNGKKAFHTYHEAIKYAFEVLEYGN